MQKIYVKPPFIKLEQFLKFAAVTSTGGEAKVLIQGGQVKVNGEACAMRGKKLSGGETVSVFDTDYEVILDAH
jgi:ribosome-associated protein